MNKLFILIVLIFITGCGNTPTLAIINPHQEFNERCPDNEVMVGRADAYIWCASIQMPTDN